MVPGAVDPDDKPSHHPLVVPRPKLGAPVTLVATASGLSARGHLSMWSANDSGLMLVSRVQTTEANVDALVGQRIWVSTVPAESSGRIFCQATARAVRGHPEQLELTSVTRMTSEARRGELRAHVAHPIQLVDEGGAARATSTVDLSSSGARVHLRRGAALQAGDLMAASITIGPGEPVRAQAQIVRVDTERKEIGIQFTAVEARDLARLHRDVLAWLDTALWSGQT